MDISSIGSTPSTSTSSSVGLGGTSALPANVQSTIMNQNSNLALLPSPSGFGIGGNLDIYDAVNKQNMGMMSGLSAVEYSNISLGIDMSKLDPTGKPSQPASTSSVPAPASTSSSSSSSTSSSGSSTTPAVDYSNAQFASDYSSGASGWFNDEGWVDPNATGNSTNAAGATGATDGSGSAGATDASTPIDPTADNFAFSDPFDPANPNAFISGTSVPVSSQSASGASGTSSSTSSSGTAQNDMLDQILQQDGYVAPTSDPYQVQTDFFANQTPVSPTTTQPYVNTSNSNPNLGTLLDSLG